MTELEQLKRDVRGKFQSIRANFQKLSSGSLNLAERIEIRNKIISDFDSVKQAFTELNRLEKN